MDVYETIKTIGSGSFGQVYMARHKREGKNYVIKRVKTRDMSQKDLENTENEVSYCFIKVCVIGKIATKNKTHQYRCLQGLVC